MAGVCLLFHVPLLAAQEEPILHYRTKANYLVHLGSFVDWPDSAFPAVHSPFQLCTFESADFVGAIRPLAQELLARGRSIEVRSAKTVAETRSCHILFIGRENASRYRTILDPIEDLPVLTVGETPDFLEAGGAVNFVYGESLRLELNLNATNRAHLKVRSTLATMARRVVGAGGLKQP
ncbi:MAG TPA: YfiR family protein [Candidatus Acidoferrales bacterium]|jgi:hypothetical protein|nr:YfiR family protein [Candidatus Acidoferrales bacterium]